MNRWLVVSVAIITFGFSNAQVQFGVKAGLLSSSFRNYRGIADSDYNYFLDDYNNNGYGDSGIGIYAGAFVDIPLSEQFRLQPEFLVNAVQYNTAVSIPVLLKISFIEKVNVMAGPGLNYSFDSNEGELSPSINLGGSYDILENFFVDARVDVGLSGYLRTNLMAGGGYKF